MYEMRMPAAANQSRPLVVARNPMAKATPKTRAVESMSRTTHATTCPVRSALNPSPEPGTPAGV
jgi:hypothetical protein